MGALFPQLPLIENIARRGKKSKLFDNDGSDNVSSSNGSMHKKQKKIKGIEQKEQHASHESDDQESDETVSSEEESDDESMSYDLFSDKLKKHKGNAWNLFKHFGSNLAEKYNLDVMEECLTKMVHWDPRCRITPEQVLKEYFPKNTTNENMTKYGHEKDEDDEDD